MSAQIAHSTGRSVPIWRDETAWMKASDLLAILLAASLPWSTSLVAIFALLFVASLAPTFSAKEFVRSVQRPASMFPVALFVLAVIGTLWANEIPWASRLHGINPVAKLLMVPLLIYHVERSQRGMWIAITFFVSCCVLLAVSWIIFYAGIMTSYWEGVPVKNYIAQSQEFALCAFGAFGAALFFYRKNSIRIAFALAALACAFVANMIFVISSRTVLICLPALLLLFALRFFGIKSIIAAIAVAAILAATAWFASASLRDRVNTVSAEYKRYIETNDVNSTAMRLEFWRKSISFIERAPLVGHGTGATKTLFERDAVGKTGVSSEVIGNPHNQTLNVAVQWGLIGVALLYAMWIVHAAMFTGVGLAAWIGLVAVSENFVSSIFNSHLFDFTEGWVYVLAVGVAAGLVYRENKESAGASAS